MQTSYNNNQPVAAAGVREGLNPDVIRSYNNPSDVIPFGQFVAKHASANDAVMLPAASGNLIKGVTIKDVTQVGLSFPLKSSVSVLSQGRIWVPSEEALTTASDVFIRYAGKAQQQTITLDADLVASNAIAVTVNGTEITYTFAADHDASMAAFAALIAAHPAVNTATLEGGDNRVITVTSASVDADVTLTDAAVTLGAGQAGIVVAETVESVANASRGKVRSDADSSSALDASAYAKVLDYNAASGLALISVLING